MMRDRSLGRAAAALLLAGALAACEDDVDVITMPTGPGGALFASYVALGNSITAGMQSGGINDSTQRQSYARILAEQAGTRYAFPALAKPGCPPPLRSLTGERVGDAPANSCAYRLPASVTTVLNNVAVPGAWTVDPTSPTFITLNASFLANVILGGKTQVARALEADPTFITFWVGNNDVLFPALSGVITPTPGLSPGLPALATFAQQYDAALDAVQQADRLQGGALLSIINVTNAPILFPAAALLANAAFKAGFDQYAGTTTTVLPNCTGSTSLLNFRIVEAIRRYVANNADPTGHPPVISCEKGQFPQSALVGEVFVLDAAEQTAVSTRIGEMNVYIEAKADSLGFAYVDVNPTLQQLRASGQIPPVPQLGTPTQPFGEYVSIDGVHPSGRTHLLFANLLIEAINAEYGTNIPQAQ